MDPIDALLGVGSGADFVRLYRAQVTAEQLAEYLNPRPEDSLAAVFAELEARSEPWATADRSEGPTQ